MVMLLGIEKENRWQVKPGMSGNFHRNTQPLLFGRKIHPVEIIKAEAERLK
jgi:hypothetical protein